MLTINGCTTLYFAPQSAVEEKGAGVEILPNFVTIGDRHVAIIESL